MQIVKIGLLLFALLVASVLFVAFLASKILRLQADSKDSQLSKSVGDGRQQATAREADSARFYVAAMQFVMFEVGAIFLFAWAMLVRGWLVLHSGAFAVVSICVFLGILAIGFVWVHKKSTPEWV